MIHDRDGGRMFWMSLLLFGLALLVAVLFFGCESQSQKQQEKINTELKTAIDSNTKQTDDQELKINGNQNEVNTLSQKFVNIETNIDTKIAVQIQKEQNAFQKSMNMKFENFKGNYSSKQKNVTNDTWFAIGVLLCCLGFTYLVIMRFTRARHNPGSTALNFVNPLSRNP